MQKTTRMKILVYSTLRLGAESAGSLIVRSSGFDISAVEAYVIARTKAETRSMWHSSIIIDHVGHLFSFFACPLEGIILR